MPSENSASRQRLLQERVNFLEETNLNYLRTLDVLSACSTPIMVTACVMVSILEKYPKSGLLASFRIRAVSPRSSEIIFAMSAMELRG